jgi:GTP-binding protein HflX
MDAVRRVLEEVEALEVPSLEVYNKIDALTPDERRRLAEQDPSAILISSLTGDGVDDLVETVASRLALDVVRMTLTFDPSDAGDRDRIARVYRHARVTSHESRDDRIVMVADVPRRLIDRVTPPTSRR